MIEKRSQNDEACRASVCGTARTTGWPLHRFRGACGAGLLLIGLASAAPSVADDFYWSSRCGIGWHQVCQGSLCNETQYWYYNNWGGEACGAAPRMPGPLDTGHIQSGQARIFDQDALIGAIDVSPDGTIFIDAPLNTHRYLELGGAVQLNEGTIQINHGGGSGASHLQAVADTTITGSGAVVLARYHGYELANLDTAPGVTITNAPGHTIRGQGHVRGALANEGLVSADVNGSVLHLLDRDKSNSGTMQARNAGYLYLEGFTLTQSPAGRVIADGGTVSLRGGATIAGGHIDAANGGAMQVWATFDGSNTFRDVTVDPTGDVYLDVNINGHSRLHLAGSSLVNDGTIRVAPNLPPGTCSVVALNDVTVSGSGSIVLERDHPNELANLSTADGVTLTQAAGHTVRGQGHVRAALANEGLVSADMGGTVLHLLDRAKSNAGTMEARNGGLLYLEGFTLTQSPAGRVLADGGTVSLRGGATIAGGHIGTANGGAMEVWFQGDGSNTFNNVTIDPGGDVFLNASVNGHSRLQLTGTSLVNDGVIRVGPNYPPGSCSVEALNDVTFSGSGSIVLERFHVNKLANLNTADGVTLTNAAGHTIRGQGHVNAALVNEGTFAVDASGYTIDVRPKAPGVVNAGTITVVEDARLVINDAALFRQTGGACIVDGVLTVLGAALELEGGALRGAGTVTGNVHNAAASVEPGASTGVLTINGDYVQGPQGRTGAQIAGTVPGEGYDVLAVSGSAALDGTLEVELLDGYRPRLGHTFVILTCGIRTGAFAEIEGQDLGGGKFVTVFYEDDGVKLVVSECVDLAGFKASAKPGKISFKMDTPLPNKQKVTVTATDTGTGDEFSKSRKAKAGRVRGTITHLPAGNYDVCVTKTPNCGRGCFEQNNVDVP